LLEVNNQGCARIERCVQTKLTAMSLLTDAGADAAGFSAAYYDFDSLWPDDRENRELVSSCLQAARFLRFAEASLRSHGQVESRNSSHGNDVVEGVEVRRRVASDPLPSGDALHRKAIQAKKDMARDTFVINNRSFLGASLGPEGVIACLVGIMEGVLLEVGIVLEQSTSRSSLKTLAEALLIKSSRSNSGAQSLFFLCDLLAGQNKQLRPVAASDLALPLIIRVGVTGGGSSVTLECTCKCVSYFRIDPCETVSPDCDEIIDDMDLQITPEPVDVSIGGQRVTASELSKVVVRVQYSDSISLQLLPLETSTARLAPSNLSTLTMCPGAMTHTGTAILGASIAKAAATPVE